MKTHLIKIVFSIIAITCMSCSSDSEENVQEAAASLSQKIVYSPQLIGFTNKFVTNYVNNKRVSEINYDGSETITQRTEFTYEPGIITASTYNAQNVFQRKTIYNYDSSNRIAAMEYYNSQNQLTGTRQYVYEGNDINVFYIENGVSTLIFLYKTNSNNLIYYEKNISFDLEQTITYASDIPSQLNASSGLQLGFEYFPNSIPTAIQYDAVQINNSALVSSIQQIKETCNYYLKKVNSMGGYMKYEKEFNADNYITHDLRTSVTITPHDEQVNGEIFYYYN